MAPPVYPDEDVQRAVSMGVCKVNFATELTGRLYPGGTGLYWLMTPRSTIPRNMGDPAREAVISLVRHRIKICAGKVGLIAPL